MIFLWHLAYYWPVFLFVNGQTFVNKNQEDQGNNIKQDEAYNSQNYGVSRNNKLLMAEFGKSGVNKSKPIIINTTLIDTFISDHDNKVPNILKTKVRDKLRIGRSKKRLSKQSNKKFKYDSRKIQTRKDRTSIRSISKPQPILETKVQSKSNSSWLLQTSNITSSKDTFQNKIPIAYQSTTAHKNNTDVEASAKYSINTVYQMKSDPTDTYLSSNFQQESVSVIPQLNSNIMQKNEHIPYYIVNHYYKRSKRTEESRVEPYGNAQQQQEERKNEKESATPGVQNAPVYSQSVVSEKIRETISHTSESQYIVNVSEHEVANASSNKFEESDSNSSSKLEKTNKKTGAYNGAVRVTAVIKQLPKASRCPPLDALKHSIPHDDTDKSCTQNRPDMTRDPDCLCLYPVAERDAKGCASKFYVLCYRGTPQKEIGSHEDMGEPTDKALSAPDATNTSFSGHIKTTDQHLSNTTEVGYFGKLRKRRASHDTTKISLNKRNQSQSSTDHVVVRETSPSNVTTN
ncbi:unnamed protein product [Thelazia callipaeda]|uniref:EGF-like domain-containing protein n=1 Tax=Thelazia callipaeda TaxID=103827 RepID=A0A158RBX8_THECL|nr:unnamed protein product [Thelazia callipaeda]